MAVIIFKALQKCNSNCIYCDVIKKHQHEVMDYDLLALLFQRMDEFLLKNKTESIELTWHGGEVCMLGPDYFDKAYEFQEKYCPSTKNRIKHLIQSNLTLINEDFLKVFRKLGVDQIGSSFEPIENIRGFGKTRNSYEYNKKFLDNTILLEKNGFRWGVIYVVHKKSLDYPLDIFHYLSNLNLKVGFNFNMIYIFENDTYDLSVEPEQFADFLGTIFPVWWKNQQRYPHIKPFSPITEIIRDKKMSLTCEISGRCTYSWAYIGPRGEASHCGRAGDFDLLTYGNIKDRTLDEIFHDQQRDDFKKRQSILPETECKDCRLWGICHGGCPLDSLQTKGSCMHRTYKCNSTKIFIEKYFEPITGLKAEFYYEGNNGKQ